jgi:diguanylate cyclase (GGDEF)-like protein
VTLPADDPAAHARAAREVGFAQGLQAMQRTLVTTPVGWALVVWIGWGRVAPALLLGWVAVFALTWAVNLRVLQQVARAGPDSRRHGRAIAGVAVVDGMAWGSMLPLLSASGDAALDAWLGAMLAGVGAVNAPVYITLPRTYRAQVGSMWGIAALALWLHPGVPTVVHVVAGLTVFYALITYYMGSIGQRVLEGIRLQLANAALAEQLRSALALVAHDALTDALTGLPNRRALDQLMTQRVAQAAAGAPPFAVLLLDIDHFKRVNDVHGHAVGDETLRAFAHRVLAELRTDDACARYGGEEFVVVLQGSPLEAAREVAERIRRAVGATPLLATPQVTTTVSIGVAASAPGRTPQDLLKLADAAVYAAKNGGRDQVWVCESAAAGPAAPRRRRDETSAAPVA